MLNIPELERRWFIYKLKSYIPYLVIFSSVIIIAIIIIIFSSNGSKPEVVQVSKKVVPQIKKVQKVQPVVVIKPQKKAIVVPATIKHITPIQQAKVQLSPSLDFMRKMQNSQQPYYQNEPEMPDYKNDYNRVPTEQIQKKIVQKPTEKSTIAVTKKPEVASKKVTIKIQNTQNDIHDIIERFKKNNNPALSLFVARKSYELGDYEQAYNYALITNKINKNIESSWLIFVKSMVKLGKKDRAVKILDQYIQQSHSNSARILRDEINRGKFE